MIYLKSGSAMARSASKEMIFNRKNMLTASEEDVKHKLDLRHLMLLLKFQVSS